MSGVIIANKEEIISISAPDIYGANFLISIFSQDTNSWVLSNTQMLEYIDLVEDFSTTVAVPKGLGEDRAELNETDFVVGDVIKIKNFIYRVTKIENNLIYLHSPLKEDVIEGDEVYRVGNMSLYYIKVTLSDAGDYIIRAKDQVFGLEITDSIKVVPKSIDTMAKEIKTLEYAILGN